MPDIRTKALGYLRDGKVTVLGAMYARKHLRPYAVSAIVQGFQGRYWVRLDQPERWLCSCGQTAPCAHLAAVQLVTGYPSAAAKSPAEAQAVAS
jgi:hypothetical protein